MTTAGTRFDPVTSWVGAVPLAHRGLHADGVPENSLAAFEAAVAAGVGVELDVRLTSDGIPVVVHDRDLRRVTGHALQVARTSTGDLAGLPLLGASDQFVPTLAAVLDLVAGRVPVMVEVKNEGARAGALEAAVAGVLEGRGGPIVLASFNPQTIRWFARHAPAVPRCQTGGSADAVPAAARPALRWVLSRLPGAPTLLSWNVHRLDAPVVLAVREAGLPVTCWTVRDLDDLALARAGADNCIFERLAPHEVRS